MRSALAALARGPAGESIGPLPVPPLRSEARTLARLPGAALGLVALPIAITLLADAAGANGLDSSRLVYAGANLLALGGLWLWMRSRGIATRALGWRRLGSPDIAWAAFGWVIGIAVAYPLAVAINALLGLSFSQHLEHLHVTAIGIAIQATYAVVVAPFAEETLFRGFALTYLRARGIATPAASLLSLGAFAAIHLPGFGAGGVLFILIWGTIPTALYLARGSLTPGWLMHSANNTWAYLLLPALA